MSEQHLYNNSSLQSLRRVLRHDSTDAERVLWQKIRDKQLGVRFLRQYGVGAYILDFYCPKMRLAIELDGGQHAEDEVMKEDKERTGFLKKQNITVLRFWNNDVFTNMDGVLEVIQSYLTPPNLPLH
jgi:very-short-patch-repair endonuclease